MAFTVIDIETLGTNSGATNLIAMPSLAIAVFPDEGYPKVLYATFDVEAQMRQGAIATASTVAFWMAEAYKNTLPAGEIFSILSGDTLPHIVVYGDELSSIPSTTMPTNTDVLVDIAHWFAVHSPKGCISYGNGNEFDHKIMDAHYYANNLLPLVNFWQQGNLRSLRALYTERHGAESYRLEVQKVAVDLTLTYFKMFGLEKTRAPTKHDPVYDVLVEGFEAKLIAEKV